MLFSFTRRRQEEHLKIAQTREQTEALYRDLIVQAAAGKLKPADEKRLEQAIDTLNISADQAETDAATFARAFADEKIARTVEERDKAHFAALTEHGQYTAARRNERAKLLEAFDAETESVADGLRAAWNQAQAERDEATAARARFRQFMADHADWPLEERFAKTAEAIEQLERRAHLGNREHATGPTDLPFMQVGSFTDPDAHDFEPFPGQTKAELADLIDRCRQATQGKQVIRIHNRTADHSSIPVHKIDRRDDPETYVLVPAEDMTHADLLKADRHVRDEHTAWKKWKQEQDARNAGARLVTA